MDGASDARQRSSLPVACSLGPDDSRSRLLRWQRLHELANPVGDLDGGRLVVRYQPGPGVEEELIELAAAEQSCCPFAEWRVSTVAGHPVLQVTAEPQSIAPIAALFRAPTATAD